MTYEYNKTRGGLGALGWTRTFEPSMLVESDVIGPRRNQSCGDVVSGGGIVCASHNEGSFMSAQGCRPTRFEGASDCSTYPYGTPGSIYCCPPGRPGTGSPGQAVEQQGVTRSQMTALQRWVNGISGCSAGTVDGVWGPNTRRGVLCAAESVGWREVQSQAPWINTMLGTATGQVRDEDLVFRPGTTPSKPGETPTGSRPSGGGAPSAQPPAAPQQAGVFGALPWWAWAAIAAGGVAVLGVVGVMAFGEEEEPAMGEEDEEIDLLETYRY